MPVCHDQARSAVQPVCKQDIVTSSFLQNIWYVAGWASEFLVEGPIARTIIDKPLVLYRTTTGSLVAVDDRCAHNQGFFLRQTTGPLPNL